MGNMGVQNDAREDRHVSVDNRLQEAIRAVEFPANGVASARQHNALQRVVGHLRENGEAGGNELRHVGWSHKPGEVSEGREQWWSRAVEPYLRDAIPGIEHQGGGLYSFDPNGVIRDRPSRPDPSDMIHPSEEQIEAALDAVDYPGDGITPGRHRASLRTAWENLRE